MRARATTKSEHYYGEETVGGQARSLGFNLTTPFGTYYDTSICRQSIMRRLMKSWRRLDAGVLIRACNCCISSAAFPYR